MRTYVYNGSWTEFQNGGPNEPPVTCRNILSGIGWARISIPSYEGGSLATWKTEHFSKIRIMDNTATRKLWEGYVDQVMPTRTRLTLLCLEPQAMLQRILAKAWGNFKLDEGIITSIEGVGNDELHDSGQDFSNDEWNDKGILITGLAPRFNLLRTDHSEVVGSFIGPPGVFIQDEPDMATSYTRTEGANDVDYWQFYGDPTELATIKVDYQLKIDWTGDDPSAQLEIRNHDTPAWEDIVGSFADNTIDRGTHTISADLDHYLDADNQVWIRRTTDGNADSYTWTVYQCKLYGTWTGEYDGTQFVIGDTIADDTLEVAAGDLGAANVHVGDKYMVGERLDVILAAIRTNETTLFDAEDIDTSAHYMYRDFENSPCLEIIRACQDVDRAEYWNDLSGSGFEFRYATSFDASGFEVNETNIDPDGIVGGYAAEHIIEKVTIFGDPETGIQSTYTAGSYTAGDPERTIWQRFKKTLTELYQMAKGIVDDRAGSAPFVGGFRFTRDLTALQSLNVGQTVDLKINMNAAGGDEIDETNALVRVIERSQSPNGRLNTMIEVGPAPLNVNEFHGKPSDLPQLDRGFEQKRSKYPDEADYKTRTLSSAPSSSPHGVHGGRRNAPLDFVGDVKVRRAGVTKISGEATVVELGTDANDEDIQGYGDGLVDDDLDAGDQVKFGAAVLLLFADEAGNAIFDVTTGVRIVADSGNAPTIRMEEDANNWVALEHNPVQNKGFLYSRQGGAYGLLEVYANPLRCQYNLLMGDDIDFEGTSHQIGDDSGYPAKIYADTYYGKDTSIDAFDSLDDLAILDTHFKEKDGRIDPTTIPAFLKDETGQFVNQKSLMAFLLGCIKQLRAENKCQNETK